MYRFTKEFKNKGITVAKGVCLRSAVKDENNLFCVVGSEVFKDIPEDYLEVFEPKVFKKVKNKKIEENVEPNSDPSQSARVSADVNSLKLNDNDIDQKTTTQN
jgi:hypothetical protein